jgi:hypothetical protein
VTTQLQLINIINNFCDLTPSSLIGILRASEEVTFVFFRILMIKRGKTDLKIRESSEE